MRRHWEIRGSKLDGKWRKNINCHVVADNIMLALHLAAQKHPTADWFAVEHRGHVDLIQQDDRLDRSIDDGFGSVWPLCEREDCGLHVVRPGCAQCQRADCPQSR